MVEQVKRSQILDLIFFCIIGLSLILSFIVDSFLVFFGTFFAILLIHLIRKLTKKSKTIIPSAGQKPPKSHLIVRTFGRISEILIIVCFLIAYIIDDITLLIIYYAVVTTIFIFTVIIRKQINRSFQIDPKAQRSDWLDQFRGLVALFLIIADITWTMSGNPLDPTNPPIGPTFLNHGWKYLNGFPPMITIIDIGQQILMFLVGFTGCLVYYRHVNTEGKFGAFLHIIRRFMTFLFFTVLVEGAIDGYLIPSEMWGPDGLIWMFWEATFPNLAWGTLIALFLVIIFPKKPDHRIWFAFIILITHSILYTIPEVRDWVILWKGQPIFKVTWNLLNHIPIAIVGTCTYDWMQNNSDKDPYLGWKTRILPVAAIFYIANWLIDFLQPADHGQVTTSLALMAMATSMFMIFIFSEFEKAKFKVPVLSDLGKNILLMYLLTGIHSMLFDYIGKPAMVANNWLALLIIGIVPLLCQFLIAWIFAQYRIYIKF